MSSRFSWRRTVAVFIKEFQQMLRDRPTFAMAVGVPIIQLVLFGYAINTDPKGLPTAIVVTTPSDMSRSIAAALRNSGYFRLVATDIGEREADEPEVRDDRDGQYVDPLSIAKAADNVTIDASSRSKFAALSNSARLQLELAETLAGNRPQSE